MKTRADASPDVFGNFELFDGLERDELDALDEVVDMVSAEPGEDVLEEEIESRDVFVLTDGRLEVHKASVGHGTTQLALLDPEAVLGELGYVLGVPRSATVTAVVESRLLRVDGEALLARRRDGDTVAYKVEHNMLCQLARRLSDVNSRLLDLLGPRATDEQFERDELTDLREQLAENWSL